MKQWFRASAGIGVAIILSVMALLLASGDTRAARTETNGESYEASERIPTPPKETRIALIITIEDYPANPGRLEKPHEDGDQIAAALKEDGFEVRRVIDADGPAIQQAVKVLAADLAQAGKSGVGFMYYSGHGGSVERAGIRNNFLFPGKTEISSGEQLAFRGVRVADLIEDLKAAQAKAVFVVIDACRSTVPFSSDKGGAADKSFYAPKQSKNIFLAFAVADGETAADDGLYAIELSKALRTKGITHDRTFRNVSKEINRIRQSTPFVSDGVADDIVFAAGDPTPAPVDNAASRNFTYLPPGSVQSGGGVIDRTIYAPNIAFPIRDKPSFLGSSLYGAGGMNGPAGSECSAENYVYPWYDSFCEMRSGSNRASLNCPTKSIHQGVDIRAGDTATCSRTKNLPRELRKEVEVIAVDSGKIIYIGKYTIDLQSNDRIFRYLHLNMAALAVNVGDQVKKGQLIGYLSNEFGEDSAGKQVATILHLHFEMKQNLDGVGWTWVSPYMSLVRAYERDRNVNGIELGWYKPLPTPVQTSQ